MSFIRHREIFEEIASIDSSAQVFIVNHSVSCFNRGRLYFNLGKWDRAESELKEALKINPHYIEKPAVFLFISMRRQEEQILPDLFYPL
ncbi:tetratricopeptide repeat protein [bacterium]|nr:tetratricopeptide repeat protein [bacterium]